MTVLCGGLYQQLRARLADEPVDKISLGFLIGQAEKVYLGACDGCMTKDVALKDAALLIASVYGLHSVVIEPPGAVNSAELWIYRPPLRFVEFLLDSPEWNLQRAAMCGVPAHKIDLHFHQQTR